MHINTRIARLFQVPAAVVLLLLYLFLASVSFMVVHLTALVGASASWVIGEPFSVQDQVNELIEGWP